jgi:lipopolysaccharide/colanic/teichoic acid biosynthesis glycosyltransferase
MLLPLLVPVVIILRFTGEGYVFYRQERVGKGGRLFGLYKFATMLKDSPSLPGGLLTQKGDARILPFGRILRVSKINEIPQLLNVLRGDMSLIGPRPQAQSHFDVFPEHVRKEIIKVRPGLSGIGSIMFRDEDLILAQCDGNEHEFYAKDIAPYKGKLEIWYIQHRSMMLDLMLIGLTIWVVLFPRTRMPRKFLGELPTPDSVALLRCMESCHVDGKRTPALDELRAERDMA